MVHMQNRHLLEHFTLLGGQMIRQAFQVEFLKQHTCPTHRLQQGAVQFVVHAHAVAERLLDRVTRPVVVAGGHTRRIWLARGAQEDTLCIFGCTSDAEGRGAKPRLLQVMRAWCSQRAVQHRRHRVECATPQSQGGCRQAPLSMPSALLHSLQVLQPG